MFTGIIEEMGIIHAIHTQGDGIKVDIASKTTKQDLQLGHSISVNGCCLTITNINKGSWSVEMVPQTLKMTTFGVKLNVGDHVNLERAMKASDRFGGHIVQGHIDGIGTIHHKTQLSDGSWLVRISLPQHLEQYIVNKGSIAIDGVSLTVAECGNSFFEFAMIPHTALVTTLGQKEIGSHVNIEVDILAKYVQRGLNTTWKK